MRECEKCSYNEGFDMSDGTPYCNCEGGYENCPFNDVEEYTRREDGGSFQIIIDGHAMEKYIKNTVSNTVTRECAHIVNDDIHRMVQEAYEDVVKVLTEAEVKKQVEKQVAEFMAGDITVGGGWSGPARTIPREEYLTELISKQMEKGFEKDTLEREIMRIAKEEISRFGRNLRDRVNLNVKSAFDEITRQTLTDNVVNMLMSSDTYKQLANTMSNLLPEKQGGKVNV